MVEDLLFVFQHLLSQVLLFQLQKLMHLMLFQPFNWCFSRFFWCRLVGGVASGFGAGFRTGLVGAGFSAGFSAVGFCVAGTGLG